MRITGYKHREDFERVIQINDACYSGVYRPPRKTVADMISVSEVFIARVNEKDFSHSFPEDLPDENYIIGFAIVRNAFQPYIWNIAVDPAYQNRGVAGNLLREIIRRYTLEKSSRITLHVNVENPAQKLYFDYGFRVISVEEDYFAPNDGLMMERKLP
jgi:ribosomal protein S18 acetylase RimI-like enzyme